MHKIRMTRHRREQRRLCSQVWQQRARSFNGVLIIDSLTTADRRAAVAALKAACQSRSAVDHSKRPEA